MKLFFHYILIALIVFSCEDNKNSYAYIGGEIINPYTNFVVISKSDSLLDTIQLDKNNRFIYKIDNLDDGLYTFKHGGEIQMVLLEPNDSIIFRLNTLDFDESLVFTGDGDKKNNYLINDFLQKEIDEKEIYKFCQLDPVAYQNQIDSLKAEKELKLKTFKKKYNPSDLFIKIAQASIDYNYYTSKEIYPFVHYGDNKRDILKSLPTDFYDYRKEINYNNDANKDYYNYNSFLRTTFDNLALKDHINHSDVDFRKTLCYNLDRLNIVDSVISNPSIKNDILFHYTIKYLTRSNDSDGNNKMLASYLSKNTDTENKNIITSVAKSIDSLKIGNNFPNVYLVDLTNKEINTNNLIKKPTVFYFWSKSFYDHFQDSHKKAKELVIKYPEINFISINIDENIPDFCMDFIEKNGLSYDNEFRFKNSEEYKLSLAIYPITKTFIVDKENKIIDPNTNIFAANFEEKLLGLINK